MMVDTLCHRCHTSQVWPAGQLCQHCKTAVTQTTTPATAAAGSGR